MWQDDDIFDFAISFLLYFRLQAKKGVVQDDRTHSLTFLNALGEPAYADTVTTLLTCIMNYPSEWDDGYLPTHLCVMGLANQINTDARSRALAVVPKIRRTISVGDEWDRRARFRAPPGLRALMPATMVVLIIGTLVGAHRGRIIAMILVLVGTAHWFRVVVMAAGRGLPPRPGADMLVLIATGAILTPPWSVMRVAALGMPRLIVTSLLLHCSLKSTKRIFGGCEGSYRVGLACPLEGFSRESE